MFRLPRFLIFLATSLFCVGALAAGCKSPPKTTTWLDRFDSVYAQNKSLANSYHPDELTKLRTEKRSLDELLSSAPADRPEEVANAVVRGEALANQMDVISMSATLSDDAASVTNAAVISQGNTDPTTWANLLGDMKKTAAEVIQDVACGEAWSMLSNSQKQRIGVPTESHDHVGGAMEAISGKAQSILEANWLPGSLNRVISWARYAEGIHAKATAIAGFLSDGYFTSEDTRAYYYYARFCLKPPG